MIISTLQKRATVLQITHSLLQQTLNEQELDGTIQLCIKGIGYVREKTIRPDSSCNVMLLLTVVLAMEIYHLLNLANHKDAQANTWPYAPACSTWEFTVLRNFLDIPQTTCSTHIRYISCSACGMVSLSTQSCQHGSLDFSCTETIKLTFDR